MLHRALLVSLIVCCAFPVCGQRPLKNDTAKVTIKKLMPPLNTPFNDYAPVIVPMVRQ